MYLERLFDESVQVHMAVENLRQTYLKPDNEYHSLAQQRDSALINNLETMKKRMTNAVPSRSLTPVLRRAGGGVQQQASAAALYATSLDQQPQQQKQNSPLSLERNGYIKRVRQSERLRNLQKPKEPVTMVGVLKALLTKDEPPAEKNKHSAPGLSLLAVAEERRRGGGSDTVLKNISLQQAAAITSLQKIRLQQTEAKTTVEIQEENFQAKNLDETEQPGKDTQYHSWQQRPDAMSKVLRQSKGLKRVNQSFQLNRTTSATLNDEEQDEVDTEMQQPDVKGEVHTLQEEYSLELQLKLKRKLHEWRKPNCHITSYQQHQEAPTEPQPQMPTSKIEDKKNIIILAKKPPIAPVLDTVNTEYEELMCLDDRGAKTRKRIAEHSRSLVHRSGLSIIRQKHSRLASLHAKSTLIAGAIPERIEAFVNRKVAWHLESGQLESVATHSREALLAEHAAQNVSKRQKTPLQAHESVTANTPNIKKNISPLSRFSTAWLQRFKNLLDVSALEEKENNQPTLIQRQRVRGLSNFKEIDKAYSNLRTNAIEYEQQVRQAQQIQQQQYRLKANTILQRRSIRLNEQF